MTACSTGLAAATELPAAAGEGGLGEVFGFFLRGDFRGVVSFLTVGSLDGLIATMMSPAAAFLLALRGLGTLGGLGTVEGGGFAAARASTCIRISVDIGFNT